MKANAKTRKRLPAEERRRQILSSAVRVFARSNFQSARVADIAAISAEARARGITLIMDSDGPRGAALNIDPSCAGEATGAWLAGNVAAVATLAVESWLGERDSSVVLAERTIRHRIPRALRIKARMDEGQKLSDYELEYLLNLLRT